MAPGGAQGAGHPAFSHVSLSVQIRQTKTKGLVEGLGALSGGAKLGIPLCLTWQPTCFFIPSYLWPEEQEIPLYSVLVVQN